MGLYLEGFMGDSMRIIGTDRKEYTIEQAKTLWESGVVDSYNLAFLRFTYCGFDTEELRAYYRNCGR